MIPWLHMDPCLPTGHEEQLPSTVSHGVPIPHGLQTPVQLSPYVPEEQAVITKHNYKFQCVTITHLRLPMVLGTPLVCEDR